MGTFHSKTMADLKSTVFDYLTAKGTDGVTPKELRRALEKKLGKEEGELDARKADIKQLCADFMAQQEAAEESEDSSSAEEEEAPPPKRAKKEVKPKAKKEAKKEEEVEDGEEPAKKEKTFSLTTKSGAEPPRNLGK